MSDRDGSGFLWFLAGLGIGAAVGILYAPKAGVTRSVSSSAKSPRMAATR